MAGAAISLAIVVGFGYHTAAFALLVLIMAGLVAGKTLAKRAEGSGPELFALLMLGVALALGIGVEFLKVNLVDPGRMNTVFKFYFHAWTLMALASAFFAWRLGAMAILRQFTARRAAWTGALVILIAAGLVYPIAATPDRSKHRFEDSPITIDGMAYMPTAVYYDDADRSGSIEPPEVLELGWDYHAIIWLQDNIEGSPVVLEGNSGLYTWGSRVSVYTGLPTVVGWDWHQQQQRWEDRDQVSVRRADVHSLYSTTDVENARRLIEKYGCTLRLCRPAGAALLSSGRSRKVREDGTGWATQPRLPHPRLSQPGGQDLPGAVLTSLPISDGIRVYRSGSTVTS